MKYLFVFLLALPLLSGCEPCDCQPNVEEPVVNCYTLRYETDGPASYQATYYNEYGGLVGEYDVVGAWEYEFEICTPYNALLQVAGETNDPGDYSARIYLDGVLWKEAVGQFGVIIPAGPLP